MNYERIHSFIKGQNNTTISINTFIMHQSEATEKKRNTYYANTIHNIQLAYYIRHTYKVVHYAIIRRPINILIILYKFNHN